MTVGGKASPNFRVIGVEAEVIASMSPCAAVLFVLFERITRAHKVMAFQTVKGALILILIEGGIAHLEHIQFLHGFYMRSVAGVKIPGLLFHGVQISCQFR